VIVSYFFLYWVDDTLFYHGANEAVPRPPLKPQIIFKQTHDDMLGYKPITQRVDSYTVRNPGTYTFNYDFQSLNPSRLNLGSGAAWTWILVAFKATTPSVIGQPLGEILDQTSLELCRAQCRANSIYGSVCMDSQRKASEWLEDMYIAMNAAPVWSGFKLKSIPYSEVSAVGGGYIYNAPTAAGPVANITEDDIIDEGDEPLIRVKRKARNDSPNILSMQHPNRDSRYNDVYTSEPYTGAVAHYGTNRGTPKTSRVIQTTEVARKILSIQARRENAIRNSYEFRLHARWNLLEPMDLITITDAKLGITALPVRLIRVDEDEDFNIECEAVPFIYGLNAPSTEVVGTITPYNPDRLEVPDLINDPVFIEAVTGLTGNADPELWIVVSNADAVHGGCLVYVSMDGGVSYTALGNINGNGTTGVLEATWPDDVDPDITNDMLVDVTESIGEISSISVEDEDAFVVPCYVETGDTYIPYELMCYAVAELTATYKYTLKATGAGNKLRRGVFSTPIVSHASGSRFAVINTSGVGLYRYVIPASVVGQTLYFKFAAFNKYGAGLQDLADCVAYPYTIDGVWVSGFQETSQKGQPNGYPELNGGGQVPVAQLGTGTPAAGTFLQGDGTWAAISLAAYEQTANKGQPNGYAPLDAAALVPTDHLGTAVATADKYLRGDQTWQFLGSIEFDYVLPIAIDGAGSPPAAEMFAAFTLPFDCFLEGWTLLADVAGDIELAVRRVAYADYPDAAGDSIIGDTAPILSAVDKNADATLTGWTRVFYQGDIIVVRVVAGAATLTKAYFSLLFSKGQSIGTEALDLPATWAYWTMDVRTAGGEIADHSGNARTLTDVGDYAVSTETGKISDAVLFEGT
jgi:hypothetical protein